MTLASGVGIAAASPIHNICHLRSESQTSVCDLHPGPRRCSSSLRGAHRASRGAGKRRCALALALTLALALAPALAPALALAIAQPIHARK